MLFFQMLQQELDSTNDDLDAAKVKVTALTDQLEQDRSKLAQVEGRLQDILEERETLTDNNSKLNGKIKVSHDCNG